ncbi:hypothetical protein MTO96_016375 [Rhipicephalus appendiculatus]
MAYPYLDDYGSYSGYTDSSQLPLTPQNEDEDDVLTGYYDPRYSSKLFFAGELPPPYRRARTGSLIRVFLHRCLF